MAQCDEVDKSLLERIQSAMEVDPDLYDVTFSVGPQKTKVQALKIILMAASPVFKNEFKTKWEKAVVKDGEGILLPEYDGESFQLFVKLTSLDTWSVEVLRKLNFPPNQLLGLLSICRRYEMQTAVKSLQELTTEFILSFAEFKDTDDFLKLSQHNLKEVLASNDLPLEETEVFKCAVKWAESKCKEKKMEESIENLRHFLRDCLIEIRFPTMSNVDFTNAMELKELLTAEEAFRIYKYVGSGDSKRRRVDEQSLGFNANRRNLVLPAKEVSNSAELQPQEGQAPIANKAKQTSDVKPSPSVQLKGTPTAKPPGCFTLSLLNESRKIEAQTPFVCDGSVHQHGFYPEQRMDLVGLGFAGPIDADGFYDVTVAIGWSCVSFTDGTITKRIFALKGQTFYFLFDQPITVGPTRFGDICYSLKGPNTYSILGGQVGWTILEEESITIKLRFDSNQLSEILFETL